MFGDSDLQPSVAPQVQPSPFTQPPNTPTFTPPLQASAPAPVQTFSPKPKNSIFPLIFGFLIVVIAAAAIGIVYYKNKLTVSSSPEPSIVAMASQEPSAEPSSTASASPKSSSKGSPKPTLKPISAIKPIVASPTPTPVAQPTLDILFGNPSANVKQTVDEGKGDGRVINREYTSIQAGQFDEVSSSWSPRVTVCYHIVSNEEIAGKNVKFTFTLDDKVEVDDNLGGYDKLEAGRIYDWCHDTTSSIGKHSAKLLLNGDKSLKESNYTNSLARIDWENLADKIAPNFTIGGPFNWAEKGTCFIVYPPSDNVSTVAELKIEQKVDGASWSPLVGGQYCFTGNSGTAHTYAVHMIDARGNTNEQAKSFMLY